MAAITYIGSTVHINMPTITDASDDFADDDAATTITGTDATDFAAIVANTVTNGAKIKGVISVSELGETSEDVNFDVLETGRKTHVNGVRDIGEVSVNCQFFADPASTTATASEDVGQARIRFLNNSNTTIDICVTDADGQRQAFQGVVANYRVTERTASSYKGCMFVVRGQSKLYYGSA